MSKLNIEYLAYADKHVSNFKPPAEIVAQVEKAAQRESKGSKGFRYVDIPYIRADESSIQGYGRFLPENTAVHVEIRQWPSKTRNVFGGMDGGVKDGDFVCTWIQNDAQVINNAIGTTYSKGWRDDEDNIYTQGADYHPDGEQVFVPIDKKPFIVVMSKYCHDATVSPLNFVAFYFDGQMGFAVKPGVYHHAAFPFDDKVHLRSIQGKVHGVVMMDAFREFNVYMRIPKAFQVPPNVEPMGWMLSIPTKPLTAHLATEKNMEAFGRLINGMSLNQIKILPWPGRERPVWMGNEAEITAIRRTVAFMPSGSVSFDGTSCGFIDTKNGCFFTPFLTSRPDGEQIIFSTDGQPFVTVFASNAQSDDSVNIGSLEAFVVPQGCGVLIYPNVWHSIPIPSNLNGQIFEHRFSAVNARFECDTITELGFALKVQFQCIK